MHGAAVKKAAARIFQQLNRLELKQACNRSTLTWSSSVLQTSEDTARSPAAATKKMTLHATRSSGSRVQVAQMGTPDWHYCLVLKLGLLPFVPGDQASRVHTLCPGSHHLA